MVLSAILIGGALPGDRAEVPGPAERAGQGSAVHPEEHRGDARGVRHRRRRGARTTRRRATTDGRRQAAGRRRHDREHPAARPERRARRPSSSCSRSRSYYGFPTTLDVDRYSERRQGAGHRHRPARAEPRRASRSTTGSTTTSRTPTATASSRPRAHTADADGPPGLHRVATCRHRASWAIVPAADLLRREDRRSTRSSAGPSQGARLPDDRAARRTTATRATAASPRQPVQPGRATR